jgi:hypothetical protein
MPPREWCEAKTQFANMFDEGFVTANPRPRTPARLLLTIACISRYPHHDDLGNLT